MSASQKKFGLTVAEWEAMEGFVNKFFAEKDQEMIVRNYHQHIHQELTPVRLRFTGIRKDGSTFNGETDMIPFPWRGEMLAMHFYREMEA
jgi:hypothetical protein